MLCVLICVLPFGCLLYYIYIYIYIYMKAEKETRCGSVQAYNATRVFFFFFFLKGKNEKYSTGGEVQWVNRR